MERFGDCTDCFGVRESKTVDVSIKPARNRLIKHRRKIELITEYQLLK